MDLDYGLIIFNVHAQRVPVLQTPNCSFKVKTNKDFVSVALNIVTTFWAPN